MKREQSMLIGASAGCAAQQLLDILGVSGIKVPTNLDFTQQAAFIKQYTKIPVVKVQLDDDWHIKDDGYLLAQTENGLATAVVLQGKHQFYDVGQQRFCAVDTQSAAQFQKQAYRLYPICEVQKPCKAAWILLRQWREFWLLLLLGLTIALSSFAAIELFRHMLWKVIPEAQMQTLLLTSGALLVLLSLSLAAGTAFTIQTRKAAARAQMIYAANVVRTLQQDSSNMLKKPLCGQAIQVFASGYRAIIIMTTLLFSVLQGVPISVFIFALAWLGAAIYGYLAKGNTMPAGGMTLLLTAAALFLMVNSGTDIGISELLCSLAAITGVSAAVEAFARSLPPLRGMHRLCKQIIPQQVQEQSRILTGSAGQLEADRVRTDWGAGEMLAPFSLLVKHGEKIGICGACGTGKTTLLRLLAGQIDITRGEIYLDGHALSSLHDGSLAQYLYYLPSMSGSTQGIRPDGGFITAQARQQLQIIEAAAQAPSVLLVDNILGKDALQTILKQPMTCVVTAPEARMLVGCDRIYRLQNGKCTILKGKDQQEAG